MKLRNILLAGMLCALCVTQASALEYTYGAPEDYLFGRPTSLEIIYEQEDPNVDRSKNVALAAPGFGMPASYLPDSGEYFTPNLVPGALDGGLVSQAGGVNAPSVAGAPLGGHQRQFYCDSAPRQSHQYRPGYCRRLYGRDRRPLLRQRQPGNAEHPRHGARRGPVRRSVVGRIRGLGPAAPTDILRGWAGGEHDVLGCLLYHQLHAHSIDCVILAPATMITVPGKRIKTDRKDCHGKRDGVFHLGHDDR